MPAATIPAAERSETINKGDTKMKRKYVEPEIKVINLDEKDIICVSGESTGGEGTGGNDNGEGGIF